MLQSTVVLSLILMAVSVLAGEIPEEKQQKPSGTITERVTGMEFVHVPGGCFQMGSVNGNFDEKPVHEVCVSAFSIGKYEVTQGQWRKIMGNNPAHFSACGDGCPVEQVSWHDAQNFIDRLNGLTGKTFRLPSEAEWEYACTSAGKNGKYCGGDDVDGVAWYNRNSSGRIHAVGRKRPNGLGIYDMSGNVWEWVIDWSGQYPGSRQKDPSGPATSSTKVRRGGSWQYGAEQSRSSWRSSGYPDDRALDIGFRLVLPEAS